MEEPRTNERPAKVRTAANDSFPDLYRLLQIAPLEHRRAEIAQGIDRLQRRILSQPRLESTESRRAQRIIELAEKHLLNQQLKQTYDQKWQQHFGGRSGSAPTATEVDLSASRAAVGARMDAVSLDSLFPSGDPDRSFDLPAYLDSMSGTQLPNPDLGFQQLQRFLVESQALAVRVESELAPEMTRSEVAANVASKSLLIDQQSVRPSRVLEPDSRLAPLTASIVPGAAERTASDGRARRGNKQKSGSPLVGVVAVMVGVCLIVGLGLLLLRNPIEPAPSNAPIASSTSPQSNSIQPRGSASVPNLDANSAEFETRPQIGSGLPKPGEGKVENFPVDLGMQESVAAAKEAEPDPQAAKMSDVQPPSMTKAMIAERSATIVAEPSKPDSAGVADAVIAERSTATVGKADAPAITAPGTSEEPKLSQSEREVWTKTMLSAKNLIGNRAFDDADKKLNEIAGKAKITSQKEQHQRLMEINKLARQFQAALVASITNLSAGEVVTVGKSTPASFVAGSPNAITFKIAGENQRYSLEQIPVALAFALADLKLDIAHPSTLAQKAAFALVHPKSNEIYLDKGRKMMLEAAQAKVVQSDLPQAFDDTFEIAD